jgi:hypothetical protein
MRERAAAPPVRNDNTNDAIGLRIGAELFIFVRCA